MRLTSLIVVIFLAGLMMACWSSNQNTYTGPPPRTTSLDSTKPASGYKLIRPPDSLEFAFEVPGDSACPVKVELRNVLTQLKRVIIDSVYSPGEYTIKWDATDSAGVKIRKLKYFYKFYICDKTHTISLDYRDRWE